MKRLALLVVVATLAFVPKSEAAFLDGSIAYAWQNVTLSPGPGTGFGDNTTITSPAGGDLVGDPKTGSFAPADGPGSTTATVKNFVYGSTGFVGGPIAAFVTFQGVNDGFTYTFNVTSYTTTLVIVPASGSNPSGLVIVGGLGNWTTNNPAFQTTAGGFTLTASSVDGTTYQAGGTLNAFNIPVTTVPEPASMMLLGSGLVGLAAAARRRRKKAE